jgi:hypothetical protein
VVGAYLRAVLTRYAGAAWAKALPGVDNGIVKNLFTHDPEQYDFKAGDLPALYIFRSSSTKDPEQLTADWRVNTDKVSVFWILPPRTGVGTMPAIARAIPFVAHLIDSAIRRGRDPSYVIDGDPDAQATREGSVVIRHAGLMKLEGGQWRAGMVAINNFHGDGKREPFAAMMSQLTFSQVFEEQPTATIPSELGPQAEIVFPARISAIITPNGADDAAVEYRNPLTLTP